MPLYTFVCEACDYIFEKNLSMKKSGEIQPCPVCKTKKHVYRDFKADNVSVAEGPKTLGSLADRNSSKFSNDKKDMLKEKLNPRKPNPKRYEP